MQESGAVSVDPIRVPSDESADNAVTGEVPDELLDKILADLEQRTGADRSEFRVLQAQAVQWNDGALGCGEPGQVYTQAIVDGYRVVVEYASQTFDYHAAANGYFKLCERFRPNRTDYPTM